MGSQDRNKSLIGIHMFDIIIVIVALAALWVSTFPLIPTCAGTQHISYNENIIAWTKGFLEVLKGF